MVKIVLITPILQHYRLTFYEKLSKYNPEYDLTVFHGVKRKEDGRPGYAGETPFKQEGFLEYKWKIHPFELVYNWGMVTATKKIDPDIVILQGITGDITNRRIISWAKRKKKKIIVWACAWEPGRAKGALLNFKNNLVASFFRKANYFLTYSTHASNYVLDMGMSADIIETCYNGIEIDTMEASYDEIIKKSLEVRKKYDLEGYVTYLYVGALVPEKRPDLLIECFLDLKKKHEKLKLIIIGDGPERKTVEDMIADAGDVDMHYLGRIYDGVDPYFAAADCFVLPGIGGLALNQAMFWSTPCIVSKADGTEDDLVIDNVTGYRFENGNKQSLIDAMERRIVETPEKVQQMAEDARQIIVEKSNVNNMVTVFASSIDKMIEEINSVKG